MNTCARRNRICRWSGRLTGTELTAKNAKEAKVLNAEAAEDAEGGFLECWNVGVLDCWIVGVRPLRHRDFRVIFKFHFLSS